MAKKKELIDILVNEYGYDKQDLVREDGKPMTNAMLESLIKEEESEKEMMEVQESVQQSKTAKFRDDDLILVMNGRTGSLRHRSRITGRVWDFASFGQTVKLPYSEIVNIMNLSPTVFNDAWIIILNKDIQKDFGLVDRYKNIITPNNIDAIFSKNVDELSEFIEKLPEGMKTTFFSIARDMYHDGKIDSKRMIDFIENRFGISLEDNAPISDIAVKKKE